MLVPVYLVIRKFEYMAIGIGILIVTTGILKFNWWDKLEQSFGDKDYKNTGNKELEFAKEGK